MKRIATILACAAWLCLPAIVASARTVPITIDVEEKEITVDDVISIRETVPVRLVNIGDSNPTNMVLRITKDGTMYATKTGFFYGSSTNYAEASVDLNTDELVTYFTNMNPLVSHPFYLSVWDSAQSRLLINDVIEIQNNGYVPGMSSPTPAGDWYVHFFYSNSVWWAVGESNGTSIGMLPIVEFSTNHFTDGAYLVYDQYAGFFLQTNGVLGAGSGDNDPIQAALHDPVGTNKYVSFATSYTSGVPIVLMQSTTDFTYEARPYPTSVTSNGFFYAIGSAAGLVTNDWDVYWCALPSNAINIVGGGSISDSRIVSVVAANFGDVIYYDIGTNYAADIPNWGQITSYVSTAGITESDPYWTAASTNYLLSATAATTYQPLDADLTKLAGNDGSSLTNLGEFGDVYLASNNVFTGDSQTVEAMTANSLTVSNSHVLLNGTFDSTNYWTTSGAWAISGGQASCVTGAVYDLVEMYQDINATDHTYTVSMDITMNATGVYVIVDLMHPSGAYAESGANFAVVSGSYEWEITGASGYEMLTIGAVSTLSSTLAVGVDNVVVVDQQKALSLTHGQINLGGNVVTKDTIDTWNSAITSESDPVWVAASSNYVLTADLPDTSTWGETMTAGNTSSVPAVFSGVARMYSSSTNDPMIHLGYALADPSITICTDSGATNLASVLKIVGAGQPWAIGVKQAVAIYIPTNGYFVGWRHNATNWVVNGSGEWDFKGNTLSNATFSGTISPSANVDMGGYTASNGTFSGTLSGTHTGSYSGNASGLTNVQPFTGAWKLAYSDGSADWKELSIGGAGQYLRSSGASSVPTWYTPSWSATATNVGLADLTNSMTLNYVPVGDGTNLVLTSPDDLTTILALGVQDITNSYTSGSFILADSGGFAEAEYADVLTYLGIGQATNVQFEDMLMSGDTNEVVYYTGSEWTNGNIVTVLLAEQTVLGGTTTGLDADTIDGINGASILTTSSGINDLNDVDTTGLAAGNILGYDGATWVVTNDSTTAVDTNALQALWQADDSTSSNGIVAYVDSQDTIVSNAFVAADTSLSNSLSALWVSADTSLSNSIKALYIAADTAVSNGLRTYIDAKDVVVSNAVKSYADSKDTAWVAVQNAKILATSNAFVAADIVVSNGVKGYVTAQDTIVSNAAVAANTSLSNSLAALISAKVAKAEDFDQFTALGGTSGQVFKSNGAGGGSWQDDATGAGGTCLVQAYGTADQTITATLGGTWDTVRFTEDIDIGGDYNSLTYTFTAPSTARYRVALTIPVELPPSANAASTVYARLRLNGSSNLHGGRVDLQDYSLTGNTEDVRDEISFSIVVSLTAADTVTVEMAKTADNVRVEFDDTSGRLVRGSLLIEKL